ncbi:hypothetical protein D3C78_1173590 [compost metagenome]
MFSEASSGWKVVAGRMRSSTVMWGLPPVVMLMMASVSVLMRSRNGLNSAGSCDGLPVSGSRA